MGHTNKAKQVANHRQLEAVTRQIACAFPQEGFEYQPGQGSFLDQIARRFTRTLHPVCGLNPTEWRKAIEHVLERMERERNLRYPDSVHCTIRPEFKERQRGKQQSVELQLSKHNRRQSAREARSQSASQRVTRTVSTA